MAPRANEPISNAGTMSMRAILEDLDAAVDFLCVLHDLGHIARKAPHVRDDDSLGFGSGFVENLQRVDVAVRQGVAEDWNCTILQHWRGCSEEGIDRAKYFVSWPEIQCLKHMLWSVNHVKVTEHQQGLTNIAIVPELQVKACLSPCIFCQRSSKTW